MNWSLNPIIIKDVRSRMRGMRAFLTLTGILLLFALFSYAIFRLVQLAGYYSYGVSMSAMIGQSLFSGLVIMMLLLIFAITPGVTAGAISSEKQTQTYEMLLATPLHPARILWGKLFSALSYVFLLLFAAVPFASLVFIFGGVTLRDMLKAALMLAVIAILIGVVGIFMSAIINRTGWATILTYVFVALIVVVPTISTWVYSLTRQMTAPRWLMIPSPIAALHSTFSTLGTGGGSPLDAFWYIFGIGYYYYDAFSQVGIPRPLYHYSLPFFLALALIIYLVTTRLVRPTRRWKFTWQNALAVVAIAGGFGGAVYGGFALTNEQYQNYDIFSTIQPPVAEKAFAVEQVVVQVPPVDVKGMVPAITEEDSIAIYTAAIQQMVPPDTQTVYLMRITNDAIGDPITPQFEPQVISDYVSQGVAQQAGAAWVWVDAPEQAVVDETSVYITLGNIQIQGNDLVWVPIKIETLRLETGQTLAILRDKEGLWLVSGNTGGVWTSEK